MTVKTPKPRPGASSPASSPMAGPAGEASVSAGKHYQPSFPIVGIGASAGGLEAVTHLLQALPADSGMACVVVQHLSPERVSMLPEILGRATRMPVAQVQGEQEVQPNCVYVIPPGLDMCVSDRK